MGDELGIARPREEGQRLADAVERIEINAEVPLVEEPEPQDPVSEDDRRGRQEAQDARPHVGDTAPDLELPSGDEERGEKGRRQDRFLVVKPLGQVEDDG